MSISTETAGTIEKLRTSTALTTLAGGGTALLAGSVAGNALNYAFGIFLARSLGTEQFGLYVLGLTFFNLLALFAPLALDIAVLKFASGHLASGKKNLAFRTIICGGSVAAASGFLAGSFLALFAPFLGTVYQKPALSGVLLFFAAALPFVTLTTVLLGALQAFQAVRYTVWVKYAWEPAGKFLLTGLAFAAGWGLYGALSGIVLAFAVSAIITFRCLLRAIPTEGRRAGVEGGDLRTLFAFSAPLIVSNLFGILAPRSDMLILGYWVSAEQVGIYNAAFQTSAIIGLVLGAFDTAVAPVIGSLADGRGAGTLQTLYHTISRWALTLALPIFVLMALWGGEVLALFGQSFIIGAPLLLVLATAQLFNTATGPTMSIIVMTGHSRLIMGDAIINGVLLICANIVLIPRYGILGAATASAVCQILISIVRVIQVWKIKKILPFSRSLIKPASAAFVAMAMGWIVRGEIGVGYTALLAFSAFIIGIFFGTLYFLGFDHSDNLMVSGLWQKLIMKTRMGQS